MIAAVKSKQQSKIYCLYNCNNKRVSKNFSTFYKTFKKLIYNKIFFNINHDVDINVSHI